MRESDAGLARNVAEQHFGGLALRDTLDVPVIARVNGHALGGGMEMVLGCDIVIAAENASFGLPEPRVGRLALDGGIAILPRRIPYVWAMGMLLTGRRVPAGDSYRPLRSSSHARRPLSRQLQRQSQLQQPPRQSPRQPGQ